MVEIGPGLGALTAPLAARLNQLHVVELDRDIVVRLKADYPPSKLVIHAGDALDFDFSALGCGLRVVGNLPYNISTPILFHLVRNIARSGIFRDAAEEVVAAHRGHPAALPARSVMLQSILLRKILDFAASAFRAPPRWSRPSFACLPGGPPAHSAA